MKPLNTKRSIAKFLLLGLVTLGIYPIITRYGVGRDMNKVIPSDKNIKTMNFWLCALVASPLTLTIALYIWFHNISNKMGAELKDRGINYDFSAKDFWLWNVLGSLILVGPAIYLDKFFKASNLLCEAYNKENN